MTRVPALVLVCLAALAAPVAASAQASPAQRAVALVKASFPSTPGAQWDVLHPKYKRVVTKAKFVACERAAAAGVGTIKIVSVAAQGTRVFRTDVPLLGSNVAVNDVTLAITFRRGNEKTNRTGDFESYWVAYKGGWARVFTPTAYEAYRAGKCP
jgi:hypothetical protein